MKIKISKSNLNQAISNIIKFVPQRSSHPILETIKLSAAEGILYLSGFDLSTGIESVIDGAEVDGSGSVCLPRVCSEIFNKWISDEITINIDKENIEISGAGTGKYEIIGLNSVDYPELPQLPSGQDFHISSSSLITGVKYVSPSVGENISKQVLTGINLRKSNTELKFAATNGHTLSVYTLPLTDGSTGSPTDGSTSSLVTNLIGGSPDSSTNITIPATGLSHLIKTINPGDEINLRYDVGQVDFKYQNSKFTTRLFDEIYPDYCRLIPEKFEIMISTNRKDLLSAVELADLLSVNSAIKLEILGSQLRIAVDTEKGTGSQSIDCNHLGGDIALALNSKYLLSGLRTIESECVKIEINTPTSPVVVSPINGVGSTSSPTSSFIYLMMPIVIRN